MMMEEFTTIISADELRNLLRRTIVRPLVMRVHYGVLKMVCKKAGSTTQVMLTWMLLKAETVMDSHLLTISWTRSDIPCLRQTAFRFLSVLFLKEQRSRFSTWTHHHPHRKIPFHSCVVDGVPTTNISCNDRHPPPLLRLLPLHPFPSPSDGITSSAVVLYHSLFVTRVMLSNFQLHPVKHSTLLRLLRLLRRYFTMLGIRKQLRNPSLRYLTREIVDLFRPHILSLQQNLRNHTLSIRGTIFLLSATRIHTTLVYLWTFSTTRTHGRPSGGS